MDTAFAKMVTDLNGRMHILIEGRIISLEGETTAVNEVVEKIVSALRRGAIDLTSALHAVPAGRYNNARACSSEQGIAEADCTR